MVYPGGDSREAHRVPPRVARARGQKRPHRLHVAVAPGVDERAVSELRFFLFFLRERTAYPHAVR